MTVIYNNTPQIINAFIPQLGKNQPVSVQTLNKDKEIIYRSFKVYSFPNTKAKDIRLIDLGGYSQVYKASSYYQITQEFRVDTYSSTQQLNSTTGVLEPSFRTWEHTTTYVNNQRQLANREKLVITWEPPIIPNTTEESPPLSAIELEALLQPFNIQIGDVYGVSIPLNCRIISPTSLNTDLLLDINVLSVKPLALTPLSFSFRGVEITSIDIPSRIITDNPKLIYPMSIINPPKIPPNITGLNTNFPSLNDTELINYATRRARTTSII